MQSKKATVSDAVVKKKKPKPPKESSDSDSSDSSDNEVSFYGEIYFYCKLNNAFPVWDILFIMYLSCFWVISEFVFLEHVLKYIVEDYCICHGFISESLHVHADF